MNATALLKYFRVLVYLQRKAF